MTASIPTRTVDMEVAKAHMDLVSSVDLTMEDSMRSLFPEDAAKIYAPDRWPWGPPKEQ